jgi:hypothetical protein
VTVRKMKIVNALKLVGFGIAIAAIDLAIEAIDANRTLVKTLKSLL